MALTPKQQAFVDERVFKSVPVVTEEEMVSVAKYGERFEHTSEGTTVIGYTLHGKVYVRNIIEGHL
jgi:hypothetical protein